MRRRRIRIQRHIEDYQPPTVIQTTRAATLRSADPAPAVDLTPAQARLLQIQQQGGNQQAMRTLIQRAMTDQRDQDDQNGGDSNDDQNAEQETEQALNEAVDTGGEIVGVNDKKNLNSLQSAALTAYKSKKYGVALTILRELFRSSHNMSTLLDVAVCEMRLDMFQEAQHDLNMVLVAPELSMSDRKRAIAVMESTKQLMNSQAVGFIPLPSNVDTDNATIAKEPRAMRNHIEGFFTSAESAARGEAYEGALAAFQRAQKRLPNPITLLNIGKCLLMLQRYGEAETALRNAISDHTLAGGLRKMAEAELFSARQFQQHGFDRICGVPVMPE